VICEIFGHQGQRAKLAFRDSYIEDAPDEDPSPRTHVGIDRVSGGARDAQLFQTAPLPTGQLPLRIDLLGDVQPWVRNLIWHVLCDIDDGLIGVGSRTTRGLGTLRLLGPREDPQPVHVPILESDARLEPAR
jgi:CRISPR/Cas system CSM-associated protein Csm3 (group 7 of RAMP superfamily)